MKNIQKTSFHALEEGIHFTVLGAVHGNEFCGTQAIQRVIQLFQSEQIHLIKGSVTFIPICNPQAFQQNTREVERNLNRHMYPKTQIVHYEDRIDPILCETLKETDYLLDLHSYQSEGGPFIFLGGEDKEEETFARHLGVDYFVHGWSQAFSSGSPTEEQVKASMGTTEFARMHGSKAATLECGHHTNADASDIGFQAIINALDHLQMIEGTYQVKPQSNRQHCAQMKSVFYKEKEGAWSQPWKHFDQVSKGDELFAYHDGETVYAPETGYLILPKDFAKIHGEWIYFGVPSEFPCSE